jgi:hypothetical protein
MTAWRERQVQPTTKRSGIGSALRAHRTRHAVWRGILATCNCQTFSTGIKPLASWTTTKFAIIVKCSHFTPFDDECSFEYRGLEGAGKT